MYETLFSIDRVRRSVNRKLIVVMSRLKGYL